MSTMNDVVRAKALAQLWRWKAHFAHDPDDYEENEMRDHLERVCPENKLRWIMEGYSQENDVYTISLYEANFSNSGEVVSVIVQETSYTRRPTREIVYTS